MSIFGNQDKGPTKINEVRVSQSVLGYSLPVVMGKGKVQQSILWVDGFTSRQVSQGGKGLGGGKGGQYIYSADVVSGLCNGPVLGLGDVWSGQSWLASTEGDETYVISGGSPSYTPTYASIMNADQGVSSSVPYSGSYNDLGAGGPTLLSGNMPVSFQSVPYGSPIGTGQYSLDPATGTYHFSPADVGKTVEVSYVFALATVKQQDITLIPSIQTVSVSGGAPFSGDGGVIYYLGPNNGVPLRKVSGTPTETGTYSVAGSEPAVYSFAPGDIDAEVIISYWINDSTELAKGTPNLSFILFEGYPAQDPWSLLTSLFPGAALGYSGVAIVAYGPMDLGYGAEIQQNTFEVITSDGWGGGTPDCNPVRCIYQVLANSVWGLGAGPVPFPPSAVDLVTWGTGSTGGSGVARADSTAVSWFAANNFFISPVIDRQDTAASVISKWLEAGSCVAFMSEGLLKLVARGDTSTAANGVTWIAPSEYAAALDDTDFLTKEDGEDPVKISISPWQDAYNTVQVQWNNRENQYSPEVTQESDQAAINRYGSRIEDPQSWDFITTLPAATFAASMRVKWSVYTRTTYDFSLPYYVCPQLEPMDIVLLTTSSVWAAGLNNRNLDIDGLSVRITKIVDNPDGTRDVTAEDYIFGVHQPTLYNKGLAAGAPQQNQYADAGSTTPVVFEGSNRLTQFQGNQIWIGANGSSANWGSCRVYASADGDTYKQIGEIKQQARLGVLDSSFPSGSDPDTTNTLVADLPVNSPALESGTTLDADQLNTLCYVDGEIVSYSACAVSGSDQYTMGTYIRRGQMGTPIASHAAGATFMRLDEAILKYTYDPTWAGKTIQLKFQSVNAYGNSAQDLSLITAVPFTIPGLNKGGIDAATGLAIVGVVGTGTSHEPVTAATNVHAAPSGNVMTADGDGNIQDSGVALSSLSGGGGGTTHAEPLTDGNGALIFTGGPTFDNDVIMLEGVPN